MGSEYKILIFIPLYKISYKIMVLKVGSKVVIIES